jgi:carnitine O-palmitoyltransferase 1
MHLGPRESKHVAVLCNGSWFAVYICTRAGDLLLPHEIEVQYERVLAMAQGMQPTETEAHIAALTAGDRTLWADARERYFKHGVCMHPLHCTAERSRNHRNRPLVRSTGTRWT